MKRASYREAIRWMAENDDTEWVEDESPILSVAAVLIADLFDVDEAKVVKDLRRAMAAKKGGAV